ncbi:hypothetical protein BJ742DRAFT_859041 [Cladochytrium replicatum]|nr:hypothetical protein BJ742DRAFT_859041 [Cladochytrium replicatum]
MGILSAFTKKTSAEPAVADPGTQAVVASTTPVAPVPAAAAEVATVASIDSNEDLEVGAPRPSRLGGRITQAAIQTVKPSSYPIKGLLFLIRTPRLWKKVLGLVFIGVTVAIAGTICLWVFAFMPQGDLLVRLGWPEWLCRLIAVFLTIFESLALTLIWSYLYGELFAFDSVFDEVLKIKGHGGLAKNFVLHRKHAHLVFFRISRKLMYRTVYPTIHSVLAVIALPLNLVPFVGWGAYFILNGWLLGYGAHLHYFDLKNIPFKQAREYVDSHRASYLSFGSAAAALQMIPVIGILFAFTNMIGAALWAANLEKNGLGPVKKPKNADGTDSSSSSDSDDEEEPQPAAALPAPSPVPPAASTSQPPAAASAPALALQPSQVPTISSITPSLPSYESATAAVAVSVPAGGKSRPK